MNWKKCREAGEKVKEITIKIDGKYQTLKLAELYEFNIKYLMEKWKINKTEATVLFGRCIILCDAFTVKIKGIEMQDIEARRKQITDDLTLILKKSKGAGIEPVSLKDFNISP